MVQLPKHQMMKRGSIKLFAIFCICSCSGGTDSDDNSSALWLNQLLLSSASAIPFSPTACSAISSPNDPYFKYQWHLENTGQAMYSTTQVAGTSGMDINVKPTWQSGLSGKNSLVSIVDDGVNLDHEDLLPNVRSGSVNFLFGTNGLATNDTGGSLANHGTAVAGIVSARGGNNLGVTGVAPCSQIIAFNYLSRATDSNMTRSLSSNTEVFVSNNSWGNEDGTGDFKSAPSSFYTAISSGLLNGRGGKGTSYVFAGGNGSSTSAEVDNSNYDGYSHHPGIISVAGALNNGSRAAYSEKGANLWITGFTGRDGVIQTSIATTDNIGLNLEWGYNPGNGSTAFPVSTSYNLPNLKYTSGFNGTSAAAPQVSGVIALILEKYPNLTWRDLKKILAKSARKINSGNALWQTTGKAYNYNLIYGFGSVDANAALQTASSWTSVGGSSNLISFTKESSISHTIATSSFNSFSIVVSNSGISKIEAIELQLTSNHANPGELTLELEAPDGIKMEFHESHLCYSGAKMTTPTKNCSAMTNQKYIISGFLDYEANGTWRVNTKDTNSGTASGNITNYKIIFYGS